MKKQLIIATLALGAIVFGTNSAQAQSAKTAVNIILSDVISIDGGVAVGGAVDFNYVTAEDYNTSKTALVPKSLIVTSTKNFDVKVKADGGFFVGGKSFSDYIPVNVLTIQAATGGSMAGTQNTIVLSTDDQVLIGNAPLGSALTLDLDYTIPAAESSSSKILGKPAGTYTQNVTYTATAL